MYAGFVYNSKIWGITQRPLTRKWVNDLWTDHIMGDYIRENVRATAISNNMNKP